MKKILIIFTSIGICITSCIYIKMTHFDRDDLKWMDAYQKKDTILFVSNYNNIDTLCVLNKEVYDSYNPICTDDVFGTYNAFAELNFVAIHEGDSLKIDLFISKLEQHERSYFSLYFGDIITNNPTKDNYHMPYDLRESLNAVNINNKLFEDCFIINNKNSISSKGLHTLGIEYIKEVVWSKSEGLLKYSFKNGEVFTRIDLNKSPNH